MSKKELEKYKTEAEYYRELLERIFLSKNIIPSYKKIETINFKDSILVIDFEKSISKITYDKRYEGFFNSIFTDEYYFNKWIEKSILVKKAKIVLGRDFKSAQSFIRDFIIYSEKKGFEIVFKKRKNSLKNSVPHFFIIK